MAGTTGAGRMGDGGLRQPLWEAGFDRSAPLYTWIQRLTRYMLYVCVYIYIYIHKWEAYTFIRYTWSLTRFSL